MGTKQCIGISEYLRKMVCLTGTSNSFKRIKVMQVDLEKARYLCKEKDASIASTLSDIDSLLEKIKVEIIEIGSR